VITVVRKFNGVVISTHTLDAASLDSGKVKPVDEMTYQELQEHGRKLLAECGGCNRKPDDEG